MQAVPGCQRMNLVETDASYGSDKAQEPKPDALDPMALREEIVNLISRQGAFVARGAAEKKADAVLNKLAEYYAAVATPEVNAPVHKQFEALGRLQFTSDRILEAGAGMSRELAELDPLRQRWIRVAPEFRAAVQQVLDLMA